MELLQDLMIRKKYGKDYLDEFDDMTLWLLLFF